MLLRRRALVVALGGLVSACASPQPQAQPTLLPSPTPAPPRPTVTPRPATPAPTAPPPPPATATPLPTATPQPQVALDIRLWNGDAIIHLDGRTVAPGKHLVPPGEHQVAALVNDEVVAIADAPPEGGTVDLVVPPPQAGLAIMVENQEEARPQTGLTHADVVYEALAEGGITRFIAIYLSGDAPVVGPVRSLRHYFTFMAADYGADVVHIGSSPEGFAWRDALNMGKLDESAADPGVWRVRTRRAPHNAYTATAPDREFLRQRGRQNNHQWGPLRFSAEPPAGEVAAEHISLRFWPWRYQVDYQWEPELQRYLRFMEGQPHVDADTGEQIAPASVVVQLTHVEAVPNDPKLRLETALIDHGGELLVFNGGRMRDGAWYKAAPRTSTDWRDSKGDPLVLPYGQVWVEVVPLGSPIRFQ